MILTMQTDGTGSILLGMAIFVSGFLTSVWVGVGVMTYPSSVPLTVHGMSYVISKHLMDEITFTHYYVLYHLSLVNLMGDAGKLLLFAFCKRRKILRKEKCSTQGHIKERA